MAEDDAGRGGLGCRTGDGGVERREEGKDERMERG